MCRWHFITKNQISCSFLNEKQRSESLFCQLSCPSNGMYAVDCNIIFRSYTIILFIWHSSIVRILFESLKQAKRTHARLCQMTQPKDNLLLFDGLCYVVKLNTKQEREKKKINSETHRQYCKAFGNRMQNTLRFC